VGPGQYYQVRIPQYSQQESEDRIVPKAPGDRSQTRDARLTGGGKAVSVKEEERQQRLKFVAAENSRKRGAEGRRDEDRSTLRLQKVRKAKGKPKRVGPARMEEAFEKVAANQGAPGPDRQSIEQVREHLQELLVELRVSLLDGSYRPGDIRRVWIPKAGRGQRGSVSLLVQFRLVWAAINAPAQLSLQLGTERS
jgi:hypothetical protein